MASLLWTSVDTRLSVALLLYLVLGNVLEVLWGLVVHVAIVGESDCVMVRSDHDQEIYGLVIANGLSPCDFPSISRKVICHEVCERVLNESEAIGCASKCCRAQERDPLMDGVYLSCRV